MYFIQLCFSFVNPMSAKMTSNVNIQQKPMMICRSFSIFQDKESLFFSQADRQFGKTKLIPIIAKGYSNVKCISLRGTKISLIFIPQMNRIALILGIMLFILANACPQQ